MECRTTELFTCVVFGETPKQLQYFLLNEWLHSIPTIHCNEQFFKNADLKINT